MYEKIIEKIEKKLVQANLLPMKNQAELSLKILKEKLETVLPWAMEKADVDMWLTIGTEDANEPLIPTLHPWDLPVARRVSVVLFCKNASTKQIRKTAFGARSAEMADIYENPTLKDETIWDTILRLVKEENPKTIAVNRSEIDGFCDGISSTNYEKLALTLGEYKTRLVDGETVSTMWLQRLCKTEIETMKTLVSVTHDIVNYTMSNEFITVGKTTTTDIEWEMRDIINRIGFKFWFGPDVDLQRKGSDVTRMFNETILPGDLVHCDIGINGVYVQLHTDMQWITYALNEGENDIPQDIKQLMEKGNKMQDIVCENLKSQKTGNDVFLTALQQGKDAGLNPMIYTHPIGTFGHGAGPRIGQYGNQTFLKHSGERKIEADTAYALELNICDIVPCWNNQNVFMYIEEDIYFSGGEVYYFDGRQKEIITIK